MSLKSTAAMLLANTFTKKTAEGMGAVKGKNCQIQSITKTDDTNLVVFVWFKDDGTPVPSSMIVLDGRSIINVNIDSNNHMVCTMSDGDTVDAGEVPKPNGITGGHFNSDGKLILEFEDGTESDPITMPSADVDISKEKGNVLEKKTDGFYVPKGAIEISKEKGNAIESKNDGIFAPKAKASQKEDNILQEEADGLYVPKTDAQVQSDFNQKDNTKPDFIKNKPVVDEAYDGTSENAQSGKAVAEAIKDKVDAEKDKSLVLNTDIEQITSNKEAIELLNKDADTEGSVDNKIGKAIGATTHLTKQIIDHKPTVDEAKEDILYLVPTDEEGIYQQYCLIDGKIVGLDNTKVDLSGYVEKDGDKVLSTNDYTDEDKAEVEKVKDKVDIQQKAEDKGKALVVGEDGKLILEEAVTSDIGSIEVNMLGWNVPSDCSVKNEVSGSNFIQKIARVNLGECDCKYTSVGLFKVTIPVKSRGALHSDVYTSTVKAYNSLADKEMTAFYDSLTTDVCVLIKDSGYTTAEAFMTALDGKYLYYESATPITTQIDGNEILAQLSFDTLGNEDYLKSKNILDVNNVKHFSGEYGGISDRFGYDFDIEGDYTFSYSGTRNPNIVYRKFNKSTSTLGSATPIESKFTVNVSSDEVLIIVGDNTVTSSNQLVSALPNVMLEKGTVATTYQPFVESNIELSKKVSSNELGITELKILGWNVPKELPITNEVRDNKFIQKVGRVDLGSLDWGLSAEDRYIFRNSLIEIDNIKPYEDIYAIPNAYIYGYIPFGYGPLSADDDLHFAISNTADHRLVVIDHKYNSVSSFKSALQGKYLYYELATPIEKVIDGNEAIARKEIELAELKMLGWNIPKECPIQNSVSGNLFTQKIARVDLGTLDWQYRSSDGLMLCQIPLESKAIAETDTPNIYCALYKALPRSGSVSVANADKSIALPNKYIIVHDSGYADGGAFKAYIKGTYLYYELATPTTTQIDGNELLDNYGTLTNYTEGFYITENKKLVANSDYFFTDFIPVNDTDSYTLVCNHTQDNSCLLCYDAGKNPIGVYSAFDRTITKFVEGARYVRISFKKANLEQSTIRDKNGNALYKACKFNLEEFSKLQDASSKVADIILKENDSVTDLNNEIGHEGKQHRYVYANSLCANIPIHNGDDFQVEIIGKYDNSCIQIAYTLDNGGRDTVGNIYTRSAQMDRDTKVWTWADWKKLATDKEIQSTVINVTEGNDYNITEVVGAPVSDVISMVGFGNTTTYNFAIVNASSELFAIRILKGSGDVRINYRLA